jgi:hypothetical protein
VDEGAIVEAAAAGEDQAVSHGVEIRKLVIGNSSGPVKVASQKSLRILGLDLDIV